MQTSDGRSAMSPDAPVLCSFFPSYALMDKMVERWAASGLLQKLETEAGKHVVIEPRSGGAEALDKVMAAFYRAVAADKAAGPPRAAAHHPGGLQGRAGKEGGGGKRSSKMCGQGRSAREAFQVRPPRHGHFVACSGAAKQADGRAGCCRGCIAVSLAARALVHLRRRPSGTRSYPCTPGALPPVTVRQAAAAFARRRSYGRTAGRAGAGRPKRGQPRGSWRQGVWRRSLPRRVPRQGWSSARPLERGCCLPALSPAAAAARHVALPWVSSFVACAAGRFARVERCVDAVPGPSSLSVASNCTDAGVSAPPCLPACFVRACFPGVRGARLCRRQRPRGAGCRSALPQRDGHAGARRLPLPPARVLLCAPVNTRLHACPAHCLCSPPGPSKACAPAGADLARLAPLGQAQEGLQQSAQRVAGAADRCPCAFLAPMSSPCSHVIKPSAQCPL